jgi:hypothetical protein
MAVTVRLAMALALAGALLALAVPAAGPALAAGGSKGAAATQARLGGSRGFFGSRGRYGYGRRVTPGYGRRVSPFFGRRRHNVFRNVVRAIGIAYLVHALFGWGAGGGSPFGLLIVLAIFLWIATRLRRRRRAAYPF